jgi:hypothetical protein
MKTHYLLFGSEPIEMMENGCDIEAVKKCIEDCGGSLHTYTDPIHPARLLQDFQGWNDYSFITKAEYEFLNS